MPWKFLLTLALAISLSLAYLPRSASFVRPITMTSTAVSKPAAKGAARTVSLHWFRKGLRLHDNPALLEACEGATHVYPVFILDPHFAKPDVIGVLRYRFMLQTIKNLDDNLREIGSRLFVVKGQPAEALPRLFREWGVTKLTFESDTEPYAKVRDRHVCELAAEHQVHVQTFPSHTLHDPEAYVARLQGKDVPTVYQSFVKLFASMGPVAPVASTVDAKRLPPPALEYLSGQDGKKAGQGNGHAGGEEIEEDRTRGDDFSVPGLSGIGYPETDAPTLYPGGETAALARMQEHLANVKYIVTFEKPKTSPNALRPSTTVLSPYLKHGALSSRLFYHSLRSILAQHKGPHTQPPVSLVGQLLWREFFYLQGHATPNFDKMVGNPICRQIPWGKNAELLGAWEEARTGYPFIDACMTQLREEGWIHHLARHALACFLTRGDLWQSWEEGARVFEKYLLDADWSVNTGNWLWLSASAFFHQYFRVYSPVAFGAKTDKEGEYIRKYLPVLRKMPIKYIYEPWKAPKGVQETAGCVVGRDYPHPVVDHATVSKQLMGKMKAAYDANKEGGGKGGEKSGEKKRPAGEDGKGGKTKKRA
ncbi:6-4 photolyase [Nannochloropsis gaditana]|uniref:6-4 photolyase n=1 Tax=Nannochloropsis gaditana TaxID=72520 RepID=W7TK49_9STRA|nr:6-4 photolyase [Nannochloropsis gaditana]